MAPIKTWIYELSKEQLTEIIASHGIDTSGNLDELRARMRNYVETHPEKFAVAPITTTRQVNTAPTLTLPLATSPCLPPPPSPYRITEEPRDNHAKILNQIRKWGCQFDEREPVTFLERVEELREGYRYSTEQILAGMPELLRGEALL